MAFIIGVFTTIASIKALVGYCEQFAVAVILWYIKGQTSQTLQKISDAAALEARAQTQEERYASAQAWQAALSRPRVSA